MLHDPAGDVYGVCRYFCAGIEWVILEILPQFRSPLLFCGGYGGLTFGFGSLAFDFKFFLFCEPCCLILNSEVER